MWQARNVARRGRQTELLERVPPLLVGFDTETTGLDVRHDRAISYGLYAWQLGDVVRTESFYVMPDREISDGARRIHGLDRGRLENLRADHEVLEPVEGARRARTALLRWSRAGGVIVGANLEGFDLAMLRSTLLELDGDAAEAGRLEEIEVIDVIQHDLLIEPSRVRRPRRTLTHLCQHYGVDPGGHDAVGDARAAVEVLLRQIEHNQRGQMVLA